MIRTLRKGNSSVYLQHAHAGHSIGAENFEAQFANGKLVFRLTLRPVDGNQRQDENYLHEQELHSLTLNDAYVINQLRTYLKAQRSPLECWELQILSRGRNFVFPATLAYQQHGALESLEFNVRGSDA